jgi:site-specific DNA-methyltransferase (adenine-specific)
MTQLSQKEQDMQPSLTVLDHLPSRKKYRKFSHLPKTNRDIVDNGQPKKDITLDIYFGDNLEILKGFEDISFDLIYIDPPFNTGKMQSLKSIKTVQDENGDRVGYQGKKYRTINVGTKGYLDSFDDYLGFLEPRLIEAYRLLKPDGSFFFHIDYREVHYCKVLLDSIFGRESFINEIIWAYDYGARSKKRWSAKHDNILWYAKNPKKYTYRYDDIDRIPYLAPGLVGPEKAARGKTPTDTWWNTIVSPNGKEKTGYPNQKPVAIINRIIKVHSNPGDLVLDFFAGSGTTGDVALRLGRSAVLIDKNPEAMPVMDKRLGFAHPKYHNYEPL